MNKEELRIQLLDAHKSGHITRDECVENIFKLTGKRVYLPKLTKKGRRKKVAYSAWRTWKNRGYLRFYKEADDYYDVTGYVDDVRDGWWAYAFSKEDGHVYSGSTHSDAQDAMSELDEWAGAEFAEEIA